MPFKVSRSSPLIAIDIAPPLMPMDMVEVSVTLISAPGTSLSNVLISSLTSLTLLSLSARSVSITIMLPAFEPLDMLIIPPLPAEVNTVFTSGISLIISFISLKVSST
ncbi:hypothetical protein SDC9_113633 [bioreactor metagenome]|uniref:Uncharacterized protein n=1 Tax=bioreactor metagenome TaxID=1076179 RepID=A0A645BNH4_9ZZZZ